MLSKIAVMVSLVAMSFMVPGAVATVEAGDPGAIVVVMGGGSLEDALFHPDNPVEADATFSLQAGYHKHDKLKGSFLFKRLYRGSEWDDGGVRAIHSTEITDLSEVTIDDGCLSVTMEGVGKWIHNYWPTGGGNKKPKPDHEFSVTAWDCDGTASPDKIWWQVRRPDTSERPAVTLVVPTELTHGNIMIR